jgi:hypothetical protein
VLDFGQVYQGPYATLLMAKAGADVIKIEPPQGEPLRRRAPPGKSTTFPIAMLNSNKRAITLNLKHQRGRALVFRMVERGDRIAGEFRARGYGPARASVSAARKSRRNRRESTRTGRRAAKVRLRASDWRCVTPMSRRSTPIDARIGRRRSPASRTASPLSHATRRASYSSNVSLSSASPPHVPSGMASGR